MFSLRILTFSLATLAVVGLGLLAPVSAQSERRDQFEENQQQRQETREDIVESRCTIQTTRINNLIDRYSENRARYINRYNALIQKLDTLSGRLSEEGVDTTSLNQEINAIRPLVDQFNSEMNETIALLEEAMTLACGESEGAYLSKIREARISLLDSRAITIQINGSFLNDIVPELQALRANNS